MAKLYNGPSSTGDSGKSFNRSLSRSKSEATALGTEASGTTDVTASANADGLEGGVTGSTSAKDGAPPAQAEKSNGSAQNKSKGTGGSRKFDFEKVTGRTWDAYLSKNFDVVEQLK